MSYIWPLGVLPSWFPCPLDIAPSSLRALPTSGTTGDFSVILFMQCWSQPLLGGALVPCPSPTQAGSQGDVVRNQIRAPGVLLGAGVSLLPGLLRGHSHKKANTHSYTIHLPARLVKSWVHTVIPPISIQYHCIHSFFF